MRRNLFMISVFYILAAAGCSSVSDGTVPQQQGYEAAGSRSIGQAQQIGLTQQTGRVYQMGNTMGIANTGWPGREFGLTAGRNMGNAGSVISDGRASVLTDVTSDADTGITLLNVNSPVRRGDAGGLSIQGIPYTNYTVSATYQNSRGTMTSSTTALSGNDGRVDWTWSVKRDTLPGTYSLIVSGGGKMITATYTVTR